MKRPRKAPNIITACKTPFAQSTKGIKLDNIFVVVLVNTRKNTNN